MGKHNIGKLERENVKTTTETRSGVTFPSSSDPGCDDEWWWWRNELYSNVECLDEVGRPRHHVTEFHGG